MLRMTFQKAVLEMVLSPIHHSIRMPDFRTALLLVTALGFSSLLPAAEISWSPENEVFVDGKDGPLSAISSKPPGHPLVFGRSGESAGKEKFFPVVEGNGLAFSGFATACVPGLWSNASDFSISLEVKFGRLDVDQTILMVSGVFDLRLSVNDGNASLDFIGVREPAKPLYLRAAGIEMDRVYRIVAAMDSSGEMVLRVDDVEAATGLLERPPSPPVLYPDLYVGSANPESYRRPFTGVIFSLSVDTQRE